MITVTIILVIYAVLVLLVLIDSHRERTHRDQVLKELENDKRDAA